jgi:WD40 repeat protein
LKVVLSPDGRRLISGSFDNSLKLWDVETSQCIKTIPLLWMPLDIKAMLGKPEFFATANANGTVTLFDFREVLGGNS